MVDMDSSKLQDVMANPDRSVKNFLDDDYGENIGGGGKPYYKQYADEMQSERQVEQEDCFI